MDFQNLNSYNLELEVKSIISNIIEEEKEILPQYLSLKKSDSWVDLGEFVDPVHKIIRCGDMKKLNEYG